MRLRRTVLAAGVLGLAVVAAAGLQGPAIFTGLRWSSEVPPAETEPPETPVEAPTASAEPLPTSSPAPADGGGDILTVVLIVIAGTALAVVLYFLLRWLARRPRSVGMGLRDVGTLSTPPDPVVEPEPEPEAPAVLRGVEEALRSLDTEREPGDAVLQAWLGLERSAEQSGVRRRGAETPTEFTRRILSRVSADDRAVGDLLSLYLRARFGEHPVTDSDVVLARAALEALARSWHDGSAVPSTVRARGPRSAGPTTWPT